MSKIITDISNDEMDIFKKQYLNCGDIKEHIEKLEEEEPKDKRTKPWKDWYEKMEFLKNMYNIKAGFYAYKTDKKFKNVDKPKRKYTKKPK